MSRLLFPIALLLAASTALGADRPKKDDKIHPAEVRIRVEYDPRTLDKIKKEIEQEIRKALAERRRRRKLSAKELDEKAIRKELEKYQDELAAIRRAMQEEEAARKRRDAAEAEKWAEIKRRRIREALDLARRAREIERALIGLRLADWRRGRRLEREIATKALRKLETLLREADVKTRDEHIVPPHE